MEIIKVHCNYTNPAINEFLTWLWPSEVQKNPVKTWYSVFDTEKFSVSPVLSSAVFKSTEGLPALHLMKNLPPQKQGKNECA
jgi:hypothetical protein